MPSLSREICFRDYKFLVSNEVYEPSEDSFLFAEHLIASRSNSVLDMGTGCGILGIIAASMAIRVVAVDINPHAVQCALKNARLNRVANRMLFIQGDLFSSIRDGAKFDLIMFNAPYLPSELSVEKSWLELAWKGGHDGRQLINQFIHEAPNFLRAKGCILLMQSTLADVETTLESLSAKGLQAEVVKKQALPFFEDIVLLRAQM